MQTGAQEAEGGTGHFLVYGMEKLSIYGHNGWDEYYDSCMGFSNRSFSSYFPFIFSLSLFERGETEPKKPIFFCILIEERDGVVGFMMWYGWMRSGGLYFYLYLLSISLPWPTTSGKYSNTVITKYGGCGQGAEDRVYLWDVVSRNPGTY